MKVRYLALTALFALSLALAASVHAQKAPPAGINLAVSPVFINLATDPGKPVTSKFSVTNNNNFSEELRVSLAKISATQSGKSVALEPVPSNDTFKEWVEFSSPSIALSPNETKTLSFTITPPPSAGLGYYYAIVIDRKNAQTGAKQTSVKGAAAIPLLLEVRNKNAHRELQLVDFKTDRIFFETLPATFAATVKNTGTIHIVPVGDVFIDSMRNKDVALMKINPGRSTVLPKTERTFTIDWNDGFFSRNDASKEIEWNFSKANKFRFGKYTAHLVLVYDNGERDIPIEATASFWVIPWKFLSGVALIVLTPAAIVYLVMKRKGKR